MNDFEKEVLNRLYMLHAQEHGDKTIRKVADLYDGEDSIEWCKKQLKKRSVTAELVGKNWHVLNKKFEFTINANTLTVITIKRRSKNTYNTKCD